MSLNARALVALLLAGCGGAISGLTPCTGTVSGALSLTLTGNLVGSYAMTPPETYLSLGDAVITPAGPTVSVVLTYPRKLDVEDFTIANIDSGMILVMDGKGASWSAGAAPKMAASGAITLHVTDIQQDTLGDVSPHGALDATLPNADTTKTDALTLHLSF